MMFNRRESKKDLNFELNLISLIDIMATCICFLLMTVAWIQIGSIDVSQGQGGQSQRSGEKKPTVWAYFKPQGQIILSLKDIPGSANKELSFEGRDGQVQWSQVLGTIHRLKRSVPDIT